MKRYRFSQLLALGSLILLTACQAAGQRASAAMLKSGDTIDGMGLTTGVMGTPPLWAFCSSSQASSQIRSFNCHAPVLPTLAIGHIFLLADEVFTNMNWSDLAWELSIDDQAVDLASFETFDYTVPSMAKHPSPIREVFKKATAWNIVLTNLNPGEHTLRFLAQNDTDSYTWSVNLVIESPNRTDISSVPFPPKS